MNNIFNKTNASYLIAGTLATLTLLASGVFIAAQYFQFLAPVSSLNVSFPLIICCAVVSFAVLAFSCIMIARNMNKTGKYNPPFEQVITFDEVGGDKTQGTQDALAQRTMAEVLKNGLNDNSFKSHKAAGEQHFDNRANGTVGSDQTQETRDVPAQITVAEVMKNGLNDNSFKSRKVTEEEYSKVFAFASFAFTGISVIAANFLSGLISNGVSTINNKMVLANGFQYQPGYYSTQFEAEKNSDGTNHLLQEAIQSKIVVFLKALKEGDEKGYSMNDKQDSEDNDRVPDNSLSYIQPVIGKREVLAY